MAQACPASRCLLIPLSFRRTARCGHHNSTRCLYNCRTAQSLKRTRWQPQRVATLLLIATMMVLGSIGNGKCHHSSTKIIPLYTVQINVGNRTTYPKSQEVKELGASTSSSSSLLLLLLTLLHHLLLIIIIIATTAYSSSSTYRCKPAFSVS